MKLYQIKTPTGRSLRDLLFVIFLVAFVSALLTYQLTKQLPARSRAEFTILLDETKFELANKNHNGLEGIDIEQQRQQKEEKIQTEKNKRRVERMTQVDRWTEKEHSLQQVYMKVKKIEDQQIGITVCSIVMYVNGSLLLKESSSYSTLFKVLRSTGCDMKTNAYEDRLYKDVPSPKDGISIAWFADKFSSLKHIQTSLFSKYSAKQIKNSNIKLTSRFLLPDINQSVMVKNLDVTHLGFSPFQTGLYQLNKIPILQEMLGSKDQVCKTLQPFSHVPGMKNRDIYPDCYILPEQYTEFLSLADIYGQNKKWVFKSIGPGKRKVQLLNPSRKTDSFKMQRWSSESALLQKYFENPLLLQGMPFENKFYVLITSWSPLRVYIHSEGIVQMRHDYQKNFEKISGKTWNFKQLKEHLKQTYRSKASEVIFSNAYSLILQTLLLLESASLSSDSSNQCIECFHLLEFSLIYNASFHPILLQINSDPDMIMLLSQQKNIVQDLVSMVTASTQVTMDIARVLTGLNLVLMQYNDHCNFKEGILSEEDVKYLLQYRRELLNIGDYNLLYPSPASGKFTQFIQNLQFYITSKSNTHQRVNQGSTHHHTTVHIHSKLLAIAKYFNNADAMGDSYDDLNMPVFQIANMHSVDLIEHIKSSDSPERRFQSRERCSQDIFTVAAIQSFHTYPALNFTPVFHPNTTEYYANVPYDVILVQIWAYAEYCFSEARLNDKYGVTRPTSYTIGLDTNIIRILIVDTTHTDPWILATYTLHLQRETPTLWKQTSNKMNTCSLLQECDLKYIPSMPCGLQKTSFTNWETFIEYRQQLPQCDSGEEPGQWMIPCISCSNKKECDLDRAVWQPHHCSHQTMPREKFQQCLSKKQILFIGDSTNRGMMHYLMEQVNGSLTEWDKTHDIKIYSNINNEQTSFSFVYYPQFWLSANQRPVFDKALYQLLKQSMPLENNHNTVLVVGGVHWLSTHHLSVLVNSLKREGLSQIKVIMKSLGAGFHQPVDGLHCLSLREQRKLLLHNHGLIAVAKIHGFQIVDTFNMTMSRYKDFLQGKCACHFHRVKEVLPSFTTYIEQQQSSSDMPIHYHIEGNINRMYSEILINSICG